MKSYRAVALETTERPFYCPPAVTGGQSFPVSFPSPTFLLAWSIRFRDRVFN